MVQQIPSFSRARTLLPGAGNGRENALARAGEAEITLDPSRPADARRAGDLTRAIEEILASPLVDVTAVHRQPARPGTFGAWPDRLDPRLVQALAARVGARPYAHQQEAISASLDGRDVVVATATASGKSLAFQVPILDAALADPSARALLLFPTKALARDQAEAMRSLVAALPGAPSIGVGVYDGDTPPDQRRAARSRAHAVATNPDMLHRGVLPHHDRWAEFLAGLRYVVLDELHTYRGLFGSHVANVLRRLVRLCAHYGSAPRVVACSATIGNPTELAQRLCPWVGERGGFSLVADSTAPQGPRTFVVVNPRVVDPVTGVRRDYLKVTRAVAGTLLRARVPTLAFCRTRKAVELLTRYLRDDEAGARTPTVGARLRLVADGEAAPATSVRGYRSGYLPERRREVERALRDGEATMVASTNALELGMDIGGVDAVVLSGYPGTVAAAMQRAGRAGRRGRPSLAVLVLSSLPLDQFVAGQPGVLFEGPVEHARVDPDNPEVLVPHVRCMAHELPLSDGDAIPGLSPEDSVAVLQHVADAGGLTREVVDGVAHLHVVGPSPAEQIDLRGSIEENFAVIDGSGDVLAEVDFEDAPLYLHPGAIYAIEGRTYDVLALDWGARKARVRAVAADYYTEAISKTRVRVVDPASLPGGADVAPDRAATGTGYAHLVRTVPGFKKIRLGTHENLGFGPIHLPDLELHTTAAYWGLPSHAAAALSDPAQRAAAVLAAAHAIHHVAAMLTMCDAGDLGHAVVPGHPGAWGFSVALGRRAGALAELDASAVPHVVLFDRTPGGAGLSASAHARGDELFARCVAIVAGCACASGCPTCMGAQAEAADSFGVRRQDAIAVLQALAGLHAQAGGAR